MSSDRGRTSFFETLRHVIGPQECPLRHHDDPAVCRQAVQFVQGSEQDSVAEIRDPILVRMSGGTDSVDRARLLAFSLHLITERPVSLALVENTHGEQVIRAVELTAAAWGESVRETLARIRVGEPIVRLEERIEALSGVVLFVAERQADGARVPLELGEAIANAPGRAPLPILTPLCFICRPDGGNTCELVWRPSAVPLSTIARVEQTVSAVSAARAAEPDAPCLTLRRIAQMQVVDVALNANFPQYEIGGIVRRMLAEMGLPVRLHGEGAAAPLAAQPVCVPPSCENTGVVIIADLDRYVPGFDTHLPLKRREDEQMRRLANGRSVFEWRRADTDQLFEEVFLNRVYLRGGVTIDDGAVVFDVGANIGLFSLFAHWSATIDQVVAFEPAPALSALLKKNLAYHGVRANVRRCALGARRDQGTFFFFPNASLLSTALPQTGAAAQLAKQHMATRLAAPLVQYRGLLADKMQVKRLKVPVCRLSDEIAASGVPRVDLLKVDAEGAEADVLAGVDEVHWPIIRQVVVEAHNPEVTAKVGGLLTRKGFHVLCEPSTALGESVVSMVYATREPASTQYTGARSTMLTDLESLVRRTGELAARQSIKGMIVSPPSRVATYDPQWAAVCDDAHELLGRLCSASDTVEFVGPKAIRVTRQIPDAWWRTAVDAEECPLSDQALAALSVPIARFLSRSSLPIVKAVAVDADNVLWRGICAEEGSADVEVDAGRAAFQQRLLALRDSGLLLCLCSRNNLADVEAVFRKGPSMPLKLSDFAVIRANWESKSDNLRAIAVELGLGLDSFVFFDDDKKECAEVRQRAPEVEVHVFPFDEHEIEGFVDRIWRLRSVGAATEEDTARAAFYGVRERRCEVSRASTSLSDFIRSLAVEVEITDLTTVDIERVGQLSARTNQMNLTLMRRRPVEVAGLGDVRRVLRLYDRFGEYGLVGFGAGHVRDGRLEVSDFLLSCRALGRNAEWALLSDLGDQALKRGAIHVVLKARKGPRNRPAIALLEWLGQLLTAAECGHGLQVDARALRDVDWRGVGELGPVPVDDSPGLGFEVAEHRAMIQPPMTAIRNMGALLAEVGADRRPESSGPPWRTLCDNRLFRAIGGLVADVVGREPQSPDHGIASLGASSIELMRISWRLKAMFGKEPPYDVLFDDPSVSALAQAIGAGQSVPACATATPVRVGDPRRASWGQARVWAADALSSGGDASQIIPLVYEIEGDIDAAALNSAFVYLLKTHPGLSEGLAPTDGRLSRHAGRGNFALRVCDVGNDLAAAVADAEMREFKGAFDLEHGPMIRARLLRAAGHRSVLLIALHHAAADGWSIGPLHADLSTAYDAISRGRTPGELERYGIERYLARIQGMDIDSGVAFWQSQLGASTTGSESVPVPICPTTTVRRAAYFRFSAPCHITHAAQELAARIGATVFCVYRAALHIALAAVSKSASGTFGYPVANRAFGEEDIIGFLANLNLSHTTVSPTASFADHVRRVARAAARAAPWSWTPYGRILQVCPAARIDVLLSLQNAPRVPLVLGEARVSPRAPNVWPAPFDLMIDLFPESDGFVGLTRFNAARYERDYVGHVTASFLRGLRCGVAAPDLAVGYWLRDGTEAPVQNIR